MNLQEWEKNIVTVHLENARVNHYQTQTLNRNSNIETLFLEIKGDPARHTYIINLNSEFKYLDYQELKFARENAKTARNFSLIAIMISILSVMVAILIPILFKQTIQIDDYQFNDIKKTLIENNK